MSDPPWTTVVSEAALRATGRAVHKHDDGRVALFLVGDQVCAVDDLCPHEGYPLSKGTLSSDTLTCPWHNYKFDVRTGACLKGDESVRTFPARIAGGAVQVQVVQPDPADLIRTTHASLLEGLRERRIGQLARDTVRLLKFGVEPREIALAAAVEDAERAEYGSTHVLPVAADVLSYVDRHAGAAAVLPLMQVLELCAETNVRRPLRPRSSTPARPMGASLDDFAAAVEREDLSTAEALLLQALARDGAVACQRWLLQACTEHFIGFGHGLIYVTKGFDLLETCGFEHAARLLPGLLASVMQQTREDALPEWAWFRERLEQSTSVIANYKPAAGATCSGLRTAVLDGSREQAFDAVVDALRAGVEELTILNELSCAAAERVLRFRIDLDGADDVQEGWLDVTHILTFAHAVRHGLRRYRASARLRWLFQLTRFINNARSLDGVRTGEAQRDGVELDAVLAAIRDRRPELSVNLANAYLRDGGDRTALHHALADLALVDTRTRPIVIAHLIKTCAVAFEESSALSGDDSALPILAFVRVAAAPIRERWTSRSCHEAVRFVLHGKVPRTLT